MSKELIKLMKVNNFELWRQKNHAVWKHNATGALVVTPKTPRSAYRDIRNTMGVIRKEIGFAVPI